MVRRRSRASDEVASKRRSAPEPSEGPRSRELAMSAENAYSNYCLKGFEVAQQYAARAQELYGRSRQQLEEAEVPARDQLQQIMASWQRALSEAGNGDDAQQRAASAWLDHARQYGQVISKHQNSVGQTMKDLGEQLASAYDEAQQKARANFSDYLADLQTLASGKSDE